MINMVISIIIGIWLIIAGSASDKDYDLMSRNSVVPFDLRPHLLIIGLGFVIYSWLILKYGV